MLPRALRERSLLLIFLLGLACSKGSSVEGLLVSTDASRAVPSNPTITVQGKSPDAVTVEVESNSSQSQSLRFWVKGLQNNETVLFRVAHASLDTLLSFPYTVGSVESLQLAAVPSGTLQTITDAAIANDLITGTGSTLATVMGQVDPLGTSGCKSITRVQLLNASDGSIAANVNGPFYFDTSGNFVTGSMGDRECSYVFFNVPAGSFKVQFLNDLTPVGEHDVLTLAGDLSFGLAIP